ncbi:hypothetical protein GCM10023346_03290 [Arthrobacter gyeryongensis]|uniref:Uncharacterized protein n=2 Tax=Arthrobacter gyeryongensis TaxID=1650592 RepID=A0ABP9RZ15_9MICC
MPPMVAACTLSEAVLVPGEMAAQGLWVRLGNDIDMSHLLPFAVEEGVAFVPGSAFYSHDPDQTTLRPSFVTNSPHVIAKGIQRLSRAIKTCSRQPGQAIVQ